MNKAAHEELLELIATVHSKAKILGLLRTCRALHDADRLAHWESAKLFDDGYVPKRSTDYDRDINVLHLDDEVTAI